MTDDPEKDYEDFLIRQESLYLHEEHFSECEHCGNWVEASEIKASKNYLCAEHGCQDIEFCDCGEVREECEVCKANFLERFKNRLDEIIFNIVGELFRWLNK